MPPRRSSRRSSRVAWTIVTHCCSVSATDYFDACSRCRTLPRGHSAIAELLVLFCIVFIITFISVVLLLVLSVHYASYLAVFIYVTVRDYTILPITSTGSEVGLVCACLCVITVPLIIAKCQ